MNSNSTTVYLHGHRFRPHQGEGRSLVSAGVVIHHGRAEAGGGRNSEGPLG